jgi:hypothetical protein
MPHWSAVFYTEGSEHLGNAKVIAYAKIYDFAAMNAMLG